MPCQRPFGVEDSDHALVRLDFLFSDCLLLEQVCDQHKNPAMMAYDSSYSSCFMLLPQMVRLRIAFCGCRLRCPRGSEQGLRHKGLRRVFMR